MSEYGVKIEKSSNGKGLSIVSLNANGEAQSNTPFTYGLRKSERLARKTIQKNIFDIALNIDLDGDIDRIEDPSVRNSVRLLSEESDHEDLFDGFYSAFELLQPPVDLNALVHITQTVPVVGPIIDSMAVNVDGFGQIYVETVDFDDELQYEDIQVSLDEYLKRRSVVDGAALIDDLVNKNITEVGKSFTDDVWKGFLFESLKSTVDMIAKKETISDVDAPIAKRAWVNTFDPNLEEAKIEKVRNRTFTSHVARMKKEQRAERRKLKRFFDNCNPKDTWMKIRKKFRDDKERIGAGCIEVARDLKTQEPKLLGHVPSVNVRMTRLGKEIETDVPFRISEIAIGYRKEMVRFRRYAQSLGKTGRFVWFKEYGDPRIMCKKTGRYVGRYRHDKITGKFQEEFWDRSRNPITREEYLKIDPGFSEANELIYDARYNAIGSPYPVPRWIGCFTLAQGMIAMEDTNASWFDNSTIPDLAVKVSDGTLKRDSKAKIQGIFERRRGRRNKHSVIFIEAESKSRARAFANTGRPTVEFEKLRDIVQQDSTHSRYDEIGRLKFRASWRLPPAHVGQESQYTRQSINASKVAAEEQVFQPEREEFDDMVNKHLLPALGIRYWKMKTNSPPVADNLQMAQVLSTLSKAGFLTVGEARPELEVILNRPLKRFKDKRLTDMPFPLVLIEAKFDGDKMLALNAPRSRSGSEGSKDNASNPQDAMGARPDKMGFTTDSSVVKSDLESSLGVSISKIINADIADADEILEMNLEKHGATFLKDIDGAVFFLYKDANGRRFSFKRGVRE